VPRIEYKFRVHLRDKGRTDYCISEPERFLSRAAIERRKRQNVAVTESDLPISRDYFTLIERAGGRVVSHSNWLKTFIVHVPDSARIATIAQLSFVDSVQFVWRGHHNTQLNEVRPRLQRSDNEERSDNYFGRTVYQFAMHNAKAMSQAGFRGRGKNIGVIDAGFANVDVIPYFDNLNLGGFRNFVPRGDVFSGNDHGTRVLSTISVHEPGVMIGSAPDATFWLLRSEDVATEFPVEEDYWIRAIEFADSVGLDVVNTSLGYSLFDDPSLNYTLADLTGLVSPMSRAADIAFSKGMILVVSAGNSGNSPWQKITPAADAHNVIAVGAVSTDSIIAPFSSLGPTADGRIKPDLVSVGRSTFTIGRHGVVGTASGTSFSSPFLAGLIASLWSINPDLHRSEVIDIVKRSADRFHSPDTIFGHGITDFQKAMTKMLRTLEVHTAADISENGWSVRRSRTGYIVEYTESIRFPSEVSFTLLDENGKILSAYVLDHETPSISVSVSQEVRERNSYLHFVLNEPVRQRVFRVRL
jgi:subtilisin family serine protease